MTTNAAALEIALKALEGLTDEHAALVEHARTIASIMDATNGSALDSKLHGEYRQVMKMLLDVGKKKDVNQFEEILRKLSGEPTAE